MKEEKVKTKIIYSLIGIEGKLIMGLRLFFFLLALCSSQLLMGQDYNSIQQKLEAFVDQSISSRKAVMPMVEAYGFESYQMDSLNRRIYFQDSLHLQYVVAVIEENGWMGIDQIGKKGNLSLFLAVQHAKNDHVRKRYFPYLKESALRGESSLAQMATMQDRIWIKEKKPQIYGTQWNYIGNQTLLYPLENATKVNENRNSVGLPALSPEDIKFAQNKFQ